MFSGGLLTQILGVISLPIMARLYAPELYGEYSIYLQMIVAISIVLSFRYEHLLLLSSTHEAAINNLKTITMISCIGIIVLPIVMIANFEFLEEQYGITLNTKIIMLLVLSGFFTILSHGLALNLQKNGVFFRSTLGDSIAKALSLLCGVLFAYSTFKEYGLLLALVLGLLCKVIYLVWISKFDIFKGQFTFDFKELRTFSKRSFSLVYSHILLVMVQLLPLQFIGNNFGKNVLGQFSLTLVTLSLVVTLASTPIGNIYFQRMASVKSNNEKLELWEKTIKLSILISIPIFAVIYLTSNWGYQFFFGDQWTQSGDFARVLLFSSYFAFISRPMESTSLVLNIWWYSPMWHTFRVCSMWLLFDYLQSNNISLEPSLKYFVSLMILAYLIDIFVQRHLLKRLQNE